MLTLKNVSIAAKNAYDATPTFGVTVQFQVGERAYSTVDLQLLPDAAREVVELAVSKAIAMLTVESSAIRIEGEPVIIAPIAEPEPPEFAEVEECAPRALAPEEAQCEEIL